MWRRLLGVSTTAIIVPETLDPINLLGVLRRARGSFVIVTNEFGVVQGLVTPLDVLKPLRVNSRTLTKRRKSLLMVTAGW